MTLCEKVEPVRPGIAISSLPVRKPSGAASRAVARGFAARLRGAAPAGLALVPGLADRCFTGRSGELMAIQSWGKSGATQARPTIRNRNTARGDRMAADGYQFLIPA